MDQTSLEFLYPLPSFLVEDNLTDQLPNDETIESDFHSEQSSREISMNDENSIMENVKLYKCDDVLRRPIEENENAAGDNCSLAYNDMLDKRDQISIKEKDSSSNENIFTPTPRYDDKHSCKVLIKTVYCE